MKKVFFFLALALFTTMVVSCETETTQEIEELNAIEKGTPPPANGINAIEKGTAPPVNG